MPKHCSRSIFHLDPLCQETVRFYCSFLILAIRSVAITSFPSPGREGRLFQEVEESFALCLSGQLRPSLNLGVFKFPTAPGLSSSLSHGCVQLETGVHMCSQQREGTSAFVSLPFQLSMDFPAHIPLGYVTFPSAKRASSLCISGQRFVRLLAQWEDMIRAG